MKIIQKENEQIQIETENQIYLISEDEFKIKNKNSKEVLTEDEKFLIRYLVDKQINLIKDTESKIREDLSCVIDLRVFDAANLVLKEILNQEELYRNIKKKLGI